MHVMGIGGLDFCDGSVLPSPVGGHPEANMYDVARWRQIWLRRSLDFMT